MQFQKNKVLCTLKNYPRKQKFTKADIFKWIKIYKNN